MLALPEYGEVWYHPNGIANILSLAKVIKKYRVTFDSHDDNAFHVHKEDGTKRVIKQSKPGLYYCNMKDNNDNSKKMEPSLINTIADNKSKYTNRDYWRAVLARKLQKTIGWQTTRTLIRIIKNKEISNCPITVKDVIAAEDIFGPDVGAL